MLFSVVFSPYFLWFLLPYFFFHNPYRIQCLHATLGCLSLPHCPALPGPPWFLQHLNKSRLFLPSSSPFPFVHNIAFVSICPPSDPPSLFCFLLLFFSFSPSIFLSLSFSLWYIEACMSCQYSQRIFCLFCWQFLLFYFLQLFLVIFIFTNVSINFFLLLSLNLIIFALYVLKLNNDFKYLFLLINSFKKINLLLDIMPAFHWFNLLCFHLLPVLNIL